MLVSRLRFWDGHLEIDVLGQTSWSVKGCQGMLMSGRRRTMAIVTVGDKGGRLQHCPERDDGTDGRGMLKMVL
jgi:hypothetical protein